MRPRERRESGEQDLFRSRLDQIIAMSHPLVRLARAIDRRFQEEQFGAVYTDGVGRPPLPTRLMAGPAIAVCEVVPLHAMLVFGVADDRFDGGAPSHLPLDLHIGHQSHGSARGVQILMGTKAAQ
jgi:hypothetical protein